ncbi:MAG: type II secretion system F family protein [Elioraea sp.]|nr:type II secretion system F family protein [Elioraea sp.]
MLPPSASPLALAALAAGAAVLAALLLLVEHNRRRRMEARVGAARRDRVRPPAEARQPALLLAGRDEPSALQRLTGLIALDLTHPEQHPAPWPLVLAAASLVGVAAALFASPLVGGALAVPAGVGAALVAARAAFAHGRSAYREKLLTQLPDAMSMVVRSLKAGIPVNEAIRAIARESPEPSRREFAQVAAEQAIGVALETSLLNLHKRTGLREYGFFAVTIALQQQTGGSLTETLENLADVVRKRVQTAARGRALAGQARASAAILTAIPFVALAALAVLNPGYLRFYLEHDEGPTVAAVAFGLLGLGILTMRMMIRRSLAVT